MKDSRQVKSSSDGLTIRLPKHQVKPFLNKTAHMVVKNLFFEIKRAF